MGLNNIAEGIVDISIGHGVDPRDYSLLAFGAAGPMMLPALLDETRVQSVIVPPHPGLFSALGLLSAPTSSTPTAAAPTRCSAPTPPARSTTLFAADGGRAAHASSATASRASSSSARWTPASSARPGRRRSSTSRAARSTRRRSTTMIESFHVAYQQRTGNRFDALPGAGRDLPRAGQGADREGRLPADRPPQRRRARRRARDHAALHLRRGGHRARVRPRRAAVPATSSRAPRSSARSCPPPRSAPASAPRSGAYGEIVIERA